ncbi:hypothetical protein, partial [Bradyrhizobium sp. 168]|uniref:hypothetical protein n=1 Tax=Bradyrhizobium sp. 168 TaxID=2782639 RepID=UPI001FFBFCDB
KKESTGLRLNRLCPPYVTPSSISSFGRRPSSAHIAESKSLKNSGENTFCQSSARRALLPVKFGDCSGFLAVRRRRPCTGGDPQAMLALFAPRHAARIRSPHIACFVQPYARKFPVR